MARRKETPSLVGAKAKRMQAQAALRKQKFGSNYGSKDGSVQSEPQTVQVLLILFMSIAFAFVLTEQNVIDHYSRTITGNFMIDQFLIGPGEPIVFNDVFMDKILASIVRGLALFLIAGLIPFGAKMYSKITDNTKTNVFVLHWGTLIVLPFIFYVCISLLFPIITELIDLMLY